MTHLPRIADFLSTLLFLFSVSLLSFLYGVVAGHYELFPYRQLREAKSAAEALFEVIRNKSDVHDNDPADASQSEPVARSYADNHDGAMILVTGGPGYLESHNPNGGCLAWLMDRKGKIQHIWRHSPELWADLQHVSKVPGISEIVPVDVHLLEDGGLIVSFQGRDTWPYAVGIARLDKDSNTIWKKECYAHHWFTITPQRTIITPTLRIVNSPQSIGRTRGRIYAKGGDKVLEDMITVMSFDGEVLEQISMLDAVHKSGLIGLYQGAEGTQTHVNTFDPLHLNAVRRIGGQIASAHHWLNADDLLVSFRSINSIAILDRSTLLFKWVCAGRTLRQHSPRFIDSDNILVFDNRGGSESLGGTRLVRIGLENRGVETLFPTQAHQTSAPVYSETSGHLDINRARDAVLMAVTNQSAVFEIDLDKGTVRWEYRFVDPLAKQPRRLFTAKYCYDVSFEMNQAETGR